MLFFPPTPTKQAIQDTALLLSSTTLYSSLQKLPTALIRCEEFHAVTWQLFRQIFYFFLLR